MVPEGLLDIFFPKRNFRFPKSPSRVGVLRLVSRPEVVEIVVPRLLVLKLGRRPRDDESRTRRTLL